MKREEQTPQVKEHLYHLTLQFVRKYQPKLYKQYLGDQEDLAMEFYCQFLTPKSKYDDRAKETLLDKYDSSITSLEYLVKISVQRKLIDHSRADCVKFKSIEHFVDEFGDVITKAFKLSTEDEDVSIDSVDLTPSFCDKIKSRFNLLSESAKRSFYKQYNEVRGIITPAFRSLFDSIIPQKEEPEVEYLEFSIITPEGVLTCPCQQITPKTVCLLVNDEVLDFNRFSGECRNKFYNYYLSSSSLSDISEIPVYKSGFDRLQFVSAYYKIK